MSGSSTYDRGGMVWTRASGWGWVGALGEGWDPGPSPLRTPLAGLRVSVVQCDGILRDERHIARRL